MLIHEGTVLVFQVLHETFPQHTFLMNGLVQGVKVRIDGGISKPEKASSKSRLPVTDGPLMLCSLSAQGFLSFLSAPLIGALSDIWGRKSFLLMTVFFTCAPIPFMRISPW